MQRMLQIYKGKDKPLNDIKIFAENEKELETLIQTITISKDIEIEIGYWKMSCAYNKKAKRKTAEGKELPNPESIRTLEEK